MKPRKKRSQPALPAFLRGAVLGADVSRSRSPAIHAEGFKQLGIEGEYLRFSAGAETFRPLIRTMRLAGFRYANVTIPHKAAAAKLSTRPSALVKRLGAANTLIFRPSKTGKPEIEAHNTDGVGLLRALDDLGVRARRGKTFVMIGAGGAAAGALAALVDDGATVVILARKPAAARALKRRLPKADQARVATARWTPAALQAAVADARALVSAVPAAAWEEHPAPVVPRACAVLEMAYGTTSALARAARKSHAPYQDGLPMLVHQAAHAIELVTGHLPPAKPLLRAAKDRRRR